jgi:hypothetical protein
MPMKPVPPVVECDRQLPLGEEIFLDHVGHFVADAAQARRALAQAGFAPTPVSVQVDPVTGGPTGTGNVTAMLRRGYVEVLFRTADTVLGRELDAALARYGGVHLVAFSVADAAPAHRRLATAGFRVRPLTEMQRPVDTAGGPGIAAFTVVRVEPGEMAEGRIQILTHRTEQTVWQSRWLDHPNGAVGLAELLLVTADVAATAARYVGFLGRPAEENAAGQAVRLDRGRMQFVSPASFAALLPGIAVPGLPFLGAYGVAVGSLAATAEALRAGDLACTRRGRCIVAPFPPALGAGAFVFVERAEDLPWRS